MSCDLVLVALLLGGLPTSLVSLLAFLFLVILGDAEAHVGLKLTALTVRELVKLKLKDLGATLIDDVANDLDDSSLLLLRELSHVVFQLVLLLLCHRLLINRLLKSLSDQIADLILSPLCLHVHLRLLLAGCGGRSGLSC